MATYDLTSKDTAFVNSDSIAALPSKWQANNVYMVETTIDIAKFIANGYTMASGDVFEALEIPADSMVIFAGAEVTTAFTGTSPVVDIDFAGGDDIVDGADVSSTGWCAGGTNGQGMVVGATGADAVQPFTQLVTTTDTIDVTLTAGANNVTAGVLRVVACVVDVGERGRVAPDEVVRDQLG
jgi:hypothetical protein